LQIVSLNEYSTFLFVIKITELLVKMYVGCNPNWELKVFKGRILTIFQKYSKSYPPVYIMNNQKHY